MPAFRRGLPRLSWAADCNPHAPAPETGRETQTRVPRPRATLPLGAATLLVRRTHETSGMDEILELPAPRTEAGARQLHVALAAHARRERWGSRRRVATAAAALGSIPLVL